MENQRAAVQGRVDGGKFDGGKFDGGKFDGVKFDGGRVAGRGVAGRGVDVAEQKTAWSSACSHSFDRRETLSDAS